MLRPGQQFDRYVVEAVVGHGGMGSVYRAFDTRLQRRVALKVLNADPRDQAGVASGGRAPVDRGLREARAAAALDHPNAVAIFDVGEHEGAWFIAMELIAGRSLAELIPGPERAPLSRRCRWLCDVARALDAAHRAGLVHRDVKPANVMVREDGVIKVLDFGIARRLGAAPEPLAAAGATAAPVTPAAVTREGEITGTPAYMAPEQVRGERVDGRADQFSWGVLAYELFSGRLPWPTSSDPVRLITAILMEAPRSLADDAPDVPPAVAAVVARALEKDRERRFASCEALAAALEDAAPLDPAQGASSRRSLAPPRLAPLRDDVARAEPVSVDAPTLAGALPVSVAPTPSAPAPPRALPVSVAPTLAAPALPRAAPAPARSRLRGLAGGAAGFALAAAVAVLGVRLRGEARARDPGARAAPSASAAAPEGAPTALTDLPSPAACNAAAVAAYRAGLQAQRDASWEIAQRNYDRAAEADPNCAEAEVRRLMLAYFLSPGSVQRERLRHATELRAALGERDRLLLQAFEALTGHEPPDRDAAVAALTKASARFPGDAELAFLPGLLEAWKDPALALAAAKRATALDPGYADAWQLAGDQLDVLGRTAESVAAYEACLRGTPGANDCRFARIIRLSRMGRCAEVADESHQWVLHDPSSAQGYEYWALGLVAQRAAPETVDEALLQRWTKLAPAARETAELDDRARLAVLAGDFERASGLAHDLARRVESSASLESHIGPTMLEVELLVETGRDADAARVADAFLKRKPVWAAGTERAFSFAGGRLFEPRLLDVRRRALPAARAGFPAARDAWLQIARKSSVLWDEGSAWSFGLAMTAATPAEAAAALTAAPASILAPGNETRSRNFVEVADAFVGYALLLADRAGEAPRFLRVTTASCRAFNEPFLHTRAHAWLGRALEHTGDTAGACAAYRVVLDRWGHAKPRSVTADLVRERSKALRCPP